MDWKIENKILVKQWVQSNEEWMNGIGFLSFSQSLYSHTIGFFSLPYFQKRGRNFRFLSFLVTWLLWEVSKSSNSGSFCFPQVIFPFPHFTISSKKKLGHTLKTLLGNLLTHISMFIFLYFNVPPICKVQFFEAFCHIRNPMPFLDFEIIRSLLLLSHGCFSLSPTPFRCL